MQVLVIGGGGREHAIVWSLSKSPSVKKVYAAPGNPGIAQLAQCVTPPTPSPEAYLALAEAVAADLTVVGPEAPLVAGLADVFRAAGRPIVGPTAAAARLEGSKVFTKHFLDEHRIPTAKARVAEHAAEALGHLSRFSFPVVLKADGLAAGKGVIIAQTAVEARNAIHGLFSGELVGQAGSRILIEEYLVGEETSFIVLSDGKNILALEPTQDHKAVLDGDRGPNTGGMGAYCDSRILTPVEFSAIMDRIIGPTLAGMAARGTPFAGFLYAGLMMTADGPKVLEYNVRLGDPEAQALLHRLDCDFGAVLAAAAHGDLASVGLRWRAAPSVCVVLAAHGYPGQVRTGDEIRGIEEAASLGATVFHAGTRLQHQKLVTGGGRVLGVTASGSTLAEAIERTYAAVKTVRFDGMHFRTDIGQKGLKRW